MLCVQLMIGYPIDIRLYEPEAHCNVSMRKGGVCCRHCDDAAGIATMGQPSSSCNGLYTWEAITARATRLLANIKQLYLDMT